MAITFCEFSPYSGDMQLVFGTVKNADDEWPDHGYSYKIFIDDVEQTVYFGFLSGTTVGAYEVTKPPADVEFKLTIVEYLLDYGGEFGPDIESETPVDFYYTIDTPIKPTIDSPADSATGVDWDNILTWVTGDAFDTESIPYTLEKYEARFRSITEEYQYNVRIGTAPGSLNLITAPGFGSIDAECPKGTETCTLDAGDLTFIAPYYATTVYWYSDYYSKTVGTSGIEEATRILLPPASDKEVK